MRNLLHKSRLGTLWQQRNLMTGLALVLLGLNALQVIHPLFRADRVVLVPFDLKREVWVERNRISASYLEEMALMFAGLILENSPGSAPYKRDIVLRHTDPRTYSTLKGQLLEEADRLKRDHVTTSFQATDVRVKPESLHVELTGDLTRFVGEKRISQSRDTYAFSFDYRYGHLLIQTFQLIRSDDHEHT